MLIASDALDQINVYESTVSLIANARSLFQRPFTEKLVPYKNVGDLLQTQCAANPAKNWLTFLDDGESVTTFSYSEFLELTSRLSSYMKYELNLGPGSRIATMSINDYRTVIVYYAAWILGACVVPINCGEDPDRIQFILDNANVELVFCATDQIVKASHLQKSSKVSFDIIQYGDDNESSYCQFDAVMRKVAKPIESDATLDSEALIVYTSGTTGAPKGVVLDQYNLLADAKSITEWNKFTSEDRAMCVLPIHHVNGTIVTIVTPMYHGGSLVLNRRFKAHGFWNNLAEQKCTWVSVVPTILAFLSELKSDITILDLTNFRHIICGAGPLTVELAQRFHYIFGVRIVHGYGLSETTCYSCFIPIDLSDAEYSQWMFECGFPSIGCAVEANEMDIQTEDGKSLGENERGEIVIRGHNVMKYYYRRPEVNEQTFANGWFRSGDEGFFKLGKYGNRFYFITGRLKELIIRGGVNISPFDIDEVLSAIPGIKAAMAVGFENSFYGEEIGAYVQLEEGAKLSEAQIIKHCLEKLPFAKSPKVVVFGDTFPVTSTGKYQRNKLKPLFNQWLTQQFREKKIKPKRSQS